MTFDLKGLLLGVASAPTQIEGGDLGHSWNEWYRRGHIKDGSNPARANDHYRRWREDADLMAAMGISIYRMGIEWARLCPTEDSVDPEAVAHYREEIAYLRDKGIRVLLTLHHFTNPGWFEAKGGFTKAENSGDYLRLVELAVRSFGDLVSEYITINEPNVYATHSFFYGTWPPGLKSLRSTFRVMSILSYCHIAASQKIHEIRREMGYDDTKVSFANHIRVFEPANPKNPWHRLCAGLLERFFQTSVTKACCLGIFEWPLKNIQHVPSGEYCDFIALNYYTRTTVSRFGDGARTGAPINDLGWEIYPQGIACCAKMLYDILPRPIYITENGTCDNDDTFRSRYIYEHLKALCESGLPVERYYHWCFCDNFEWLEGESARFGLVHIIYETQVRTVKQSGQFYSELLRSGKMTETIYEKYIKDRRYPE